MKKKLKKSGTQGKKKKCVTKVTKRHEFYSKQLRDILNLPEEIVIEFVPHVDATAKVAAALASATLEEGATETVALEEKPEASKEA